MINYLKGLTMQNRILFATDFSNRDQAAFKTACDLAVKAKARLIILYVQDSRFKALSASNRKDPNREFVNYVPDNYAVNFDQVVKTGDPQEEILRLADASDVDLIVLGTHGRSGVGRVFAGSVAENVLRNSDTPVMTIRDEIAKPNKYDSPHILVPIDFSVFGYAAIDYATKLAISIGGEISIVHVDETDSAATRQLSGNQSQWSKGDQKTWKLLTQFVPSSQKIRFSHALLKGHADTAINDYAREKKCDFIVIGTHGRTGLGRTLMGSVAEAVVREAECAVITVKPSNKRTTVLG